MELNQFRNVDVVLDKANDNIIQKQFVSAGDKDGRSLTAQLTDNGVIGEIIGAALNLYWHNQASGLTDLSAFYVVDKATSVFKIDYPQNMLTPGKVIAYIQILHGGKVTHTKPFEITVQKLAGTTRGVLATAEYGALVTTLAKANEFETEIAVLDNGKVDKGGNEQVTIGMLSQQVKEIMAGANALPVVGDGSVNTSNVIDKAIIPTKLDRFYAFGKAKRNLLDYTLAIDNKYYHSDGTLLTGNNTTFSLPQIKLELGKTYTLPQNGMFRFCLCDANGVVKFYGTGADVVTKFPLLVTPESCVLKLSFNNSAKNASMLVEGTTVPQTYEPHVAVPLDLGIKSVKIENLSDELLALVTGVSPDIVTVDKKGNGQFTNIQSAVDSVSDSTNNPVTIIVNPGIYEETVVIKNRYISLIGIDKKNTIILTTTGDYKEPPLEVGGGKLYFKNITFKATHETPKANYSTTNRAYAVHADFPGAGTTVFENCDLISHQCATLGSGTHAEQKIIFKDCNFERYDDAGFNPAETNYGCIFLHSAPYEATGQVYEFYNCRIYNERQNAIRMSKQSASDYSVLWVQNYVTGSAKNVSITGGGLNPESFGNNVALING